MKGLKIAGISVISIVIVAVVIITVSSRRSAVDRSNEAVLEFGSSAESEEYESEEVSITEEQVDSASYETEIVYEPTDEELSEFGYGVNTTEVSSGLSLRDIMVPEDYDKLVQEVGQDLVDLWSANIYESWCVEDTDYRLISYDISEYRLVLQSDEWQLRMYSEDGGTTFLGGQILVDYLMEQSE